MSEEERNFLEIVDLKKGFGSGDTRQEVLCGMNFSVAKGVKGWYNLSVISGKQVKILYEPVAVRCA